jgi:hypothetical protein
LFETTPPDLLETYRIKIRLSGDLFKVAADTQDNMVSEVEEGNTSVEEWCDADERKKQEYSFKNLERTMAIKPFYFQLYTSQNDIQTSELLLGNLCVYRNPPFPFVWTF